ncbi:MAG: sterol desaturase family protein, partial [Pseudomonadales bacterium]|nr:sterol desaturase family protein [Pseudomonadales bacterium]
MDEILMRFTPFQGAFEAIELVGLIFLIAIIGEAVWDIVSHRRKISESAANFTIFIGNTLLERTLFGSVFILGLFAVEYVISWHIPISWWSTIMALVLADLTYYWMHRCEHKVRILWAYHSVHHSSPEFNLTTSMRLSWIEGAFEWLFFVPMVLLVFDVVQILVAISIVVMYQTWIHTERVGKLRWLEGILNTPSVHRVHHGKNSK